MTTALQRLVFGHGLFHSSLRLAFLSLALLVAGSYALQLIILLARELMKKRSTGASKIRASGAVNFTGIITAANIRHIVRSKGAIVAARMIGPSLALVIVLSVYVFGHHVGYVEGQLELTKDRYSYEDVVVLARHNAKNFTLQPARMRAFEMTTCTAPGWHAGEKMKRLIFQYHADCDDVGARGAFEFYTDANGNRSRFPMEELANVSQ